MQAEKDDPLENTSPSFVDEATGISFSRMLSKIQESGGHASKRESGGVWDPCSEGSDVG